MREKLDLIEEELDSIEEFLKTAGGLRAAISIDLPIGTILTKHPLSQMILTDVISERLENITSEATKRRKQLEQLRRVEKRRQE